MPTILLVDDDALTAMGSADLIEDLGHVVLTAHSGREALAIVAERADLDLVVTDQSMPGMTGVELARELATERPGLPVILATGYGAAPDGETLPTLPKPYDQAQLSAAIDRALGR
ncbi:response regulator [Salinarimonas ramus]|uniref:Response regulatory domain-containing protein n=1 Tax=Salinarimonas ramus TaxID=690164 RepID=A0A917V750_9HYPH|nr:response regulator [Salinarimonas ramus]GGK45280.1 hypothetical protein GCM10011322_35570 [Salinarimonas ramus]